MVVLEELFFLKVLLFVKFVKLRILVMSSVSCELWICYIGRNLICDRIDIDVIFGRKVI